MGPTGTPTEIPEGRDRAARRRRPRQRRALLDRQGAEGAAATASSTSPATRTAADLFKREEIEAVDRSGDLVPSTWATTIVPRRPQDRTSAATSCRRWWPTPRASSARSPVPLARTSRASSRSARPHDERRAAGPPRRAAAATCPDHVGIGSINSPMQCMMKEVCAQCLQRHVDPTPAARSSSSPASTRTRSWTASTSRTCNARLRQNSVQEKLSNLWFEHILDQADKELARVGRLEGLGLGFWV